jgi:hypothetical protein
MNVEIFEVGGKGFPNLRVVTVQASAHGK